MPATEPTYNPDEKLISENEALRAKLAEAERNLVEAQDFINAIQSGDVDAVVISGPAGDQIFSLKDAEYQYRALVEAMSEGAATLGIDGTVLYCNGRFSRILGVPLEMIIGSAVSKHLSDDTARAFDALFAQGLSGQSVAVALDMQTAQRRCVPVQISIGQMASAGGAVFCMVVTDLSESKSRDELIAAGRLATSILQSAAEAIAVCDEGGKVIAGNQALEALCGFNPLYEPFDAVFQFESVDRDDVVSVHGFVAEALAGNTFTGRKVHLSRKDGRLVTLLVSASPMRSGKSIAGCVFTLTDITDRERSVQALRESEDGFRVLAQNLVSGVALIRADGQLSIVNKSFLRMFDLDEDANLLNINSRDWSRWRVFDENGRMLDVDEHPVRQAVRTRAVVRDRLVAIRSPGSPNSKWLLVSAEPMLDGNGGVQRVICTFHDITARKQAEEKLQENARLLALALEACESGFFDWDLVTGESRWSPELERLYGLESGVFRGSLDQWREWVFPEDLPVAEECGHDAMRTGELSGEWRIIRQNDQAIRWLSGHGRVLRDESGKPVRLVGINVDVTERKHAEAALRESEQSFRALAETVPQMIWVASPEGVAEYNNQRFLDYVGMSQEEVRKSAWKIVHPDDMEETARKWKNAVETADPYSHEMRMRRHDGAYRPFLSRAVPLRNDAGEIERWVGSSTDIHEQKLAQEVLSRADKLSTAARFAASVAHEINNPLASVTNLLYLALSNRDLDPTTRSQLKLADEELTRIAHLTSQSLRFHQQASAPALVEVGEIMDSVLLLFAPRLKNAGILLERENDCAHKLYCYQDDLRHVFASLIANALEATPQGGKIRVRIERDRNWNLNSEPGIRVLIADNGHGISEELKPHVFEPFVSAKQNTRVGLGLWVSEVIIRKHNGRISFRSSTDLRHHGTVVSVFLPFNGLKKMETPIAPSGE